MSLLCSALYAKCPYYVVLYMQRSLLLVFYVQSVLLCSALYAKSRVGWGLDGLGMCAAPRPGPEAAAG